MEPPLLVSRARGLDAARCRRAARRLVGPLRTLRRALTDGGGRGGGRRSQCGGRGVTEVPPTPMPPPTPAPGVGPVCAREEEREGERESESESEVRRFQGRFAVLEAVAEVRVAVREVRQMLGGGEGIGWDDALRRMVGEVVSGDEEAVPPMLARLFFEQEGRVLDAAITGGWGGGGGYRESQVAGNCGSGGGGHSLGAEAMSRSYEAQCGGGSRTQLAKDDWFHDFLRERGRGTADAANSVRDHGGEGSASAEWLDASATVARSRRSDILPGTMREAQVRSRVLSLTGGGQAAREAQARLQRLQAHADARYDRRRLDNELQKSSWGPHGVYGRVVGGRRVERIGARPVAAPGQRTLWLSEGESRGREIGSESEQSLPPGGQSCRDVPSERDVYRRKPFRRRPADASSATLSLPSPAEESLRIATQIFNARVYPVHPLGVSLLTRFMGDDADAIPRPPTMHVHLLSDQLSPQSSAHALTNSQPSMSIFDSCAEPINPPLSETANVNGLHGGGVSGGSGSNPFSGGAFGSGTSFDYHANGVHHSLGRRNNAARDSNDAEMLSQPARMQLNVLPPGAYVREDKDALPPLPPGETQVLCGRRYFVRWHDREPPVPEIENEIDNPCPSTLVQSASHGQVIVPDSLSGPSEALEESFLRFSGEKTSAGHTRWPQPERKHSIHPELAQPVQASSIQHFEPVTPARHTDMQVRTYHHNLLDSRRERHAPFAPWAVDSPRLPSTDHVQHAQWTQRDPATDCVAAAFNAAQTQQFGYNSYRVPAVVVPDAPAVEGGCVAPVISYNFDFQRRTPHMFSKRGMQPSAGTPRRVDRDRTQEPRLQFFIAPVVNKLEEEQPQRRS